MTYSSRLLHQNNSYTHKIEKLLKIKCFGPGHFAPPLYFDIFYTVVESQAYWRILDSHSFPIILPLKSFERVGIQVEEISFKDEATFSWILVQIAVFTSSPKETFSFLGHFEYSGFISVKRMVIQDDLRATE